MAYPLLLLYMTIDEELTQLEDSLRKLKIEYEVYFNGASKRPPTDLQWRVEGIIKKYSESQRLSYAHRFRYNALAQRFAVFSDLWRQRLKRKDESPRRPPVTETAVHSPKHDNGTFRVNWNDPASEPEKMDKLFSAMVSAKKLCGEPVDQLSVDAFRKFVCNKTTELKRTFKCEQVQYVVEVEKGRVSLKAKGL
jgi:hypothetical protein